MGKLTRLWNDGVYLGVKGSTGEIIVGDQNGVWKTRTVQRKPQEDRWRKENVQMIVGVPWKTSKEDPSADGELLSGKVIDLKTGEAIEAEEREAIRERARLRIPRAFRTTDEDYQKHGYSRGCAGCKALLAGAAKQKRGHRHPQPPARQRLQPRRPAQAA